MSKQPNEEELIKIKERRKFNKMCLGLGILSVLGVSIPPLAVKYGPGIVKKFRERAKKPEPITREKFDFVLEELLIKINDDAITNQRFIRGCLLFGDPHISNNLYPNNGSKEANLTIDTNAAAAADLNFDLDNSRPSSWVSPRMGMYVEFTEKFEHYKNFMKRKRTKADKGVPTNDTAYQKHWLNKTKEISYEKKDLDKIVFYSNRLKFSIEVNKYGGPKFHKIADLRLKKPTKTRAWKVRDNYISHLPFKDDMPDSIIEELVDLKTINRKLLSNYIEKTINVIHEQTKTGKVSEKTLKAFNSVYNALLGDIDKNGKFIPEAQHEKYFKNKEKHFVRLSMN